MSRRDVWIESRVIVEPAEPMWFGWRNPEADSTRACESIVDAVKRHVDDVNRVYVDVVREPRCEFCGRVWTEDSHIYNGGCCKEDEKANPAPEVQP